MEHYSVVGQNNRNLLVQLKKVAPYHEDITRVQPFEPSNVYPGQYTKIKMDFKHATDREIVLNDIRLQFEVDFSAFVPGTTESAMGRALCVRGTDLIRELTIKINEDVVFKVDKQGDLSFLWEMNNHRLLGDPMITSHSLLLNHGIIPSGHVPNYYNDGTIGSHKWWFGVKEHHRTEVNDISVSPQVTVTDVNYLCDRTNTVPTSILTNVGEERHDGRPRVIWDKDGYKFRFNLSLNHICGAIFNKLKMRRVEYIQIEVMFEPFVSKAATQRFLMFETNHAVSPWSKAVIQNLQIQQYRTTLLDGTQGFTLCDSKMLSWLGHRYSKREFTWNFPTQEFLDIQLHDWEIRTNITRICWMLAPRDPVLANDFVPMGEPGDYEYIYAFEIRWKNDVVLDLDNTFDVYRHYVFSENKRHHFEDPFIRFGRLTYQDNQYTPPVVIQDKTTAMVKQPVVVPNTVDHDHNEGFYWKHAPTAAVTGPPAIPASDGDVLVRGDETWKVGRRRYEFPVYHIDLNMNILYGVPGTETIGGIVNDTSDYVIRIKRPVDRPNFINQSTRKVWVFLEYQTLVNLSGGSNQFNRASQVVTKQLNPQ